jgi:hypothetical protein
MKIFEKQKSRFRVGQEVENSLVTDKLSLVDLKGSPIFLVFWKTL